MNGATWLYIAACILFPLVWGVFAEWGFEKAEGYLRLRKRPRPAPSPRHPRTPDTLDYRI